MKRRGFLWTTAGMVVGRASSRAADATSQEDGWTALFDKNGVPGGWSVRAWHDVSEPGPEGAEWKVVDQILRGSEPRGTWLVSDKDYADFILEYEFRLGDQGNSGCGLRFPPKGDPAFDGLELQMVDSRYYPPDFGEVPANELSGSLYRAVAPTEQVYQPNQWNRYRITCKGSRVQVDFNDKQVLDIDLSQHENPVKRHNGEDAPSLKDRPLKGRIGFQELSRGGGHVEIRNARVKEG